MSDNITFAWSLLSFYMSLSIFQKALFKRKRFIVPYHHFTIYYSCAIKHTLSWIGKGMYWYYEWIKLKGQSRIHRCETTMINLTYEGSNVLVPLNVISCNIELKWWIGFHHTFCVYYTERNPFLESIILNCLNWLKYRLNIIVARIRIMK